MSHRSLQSLCLPSSTLSALTRAGYDSVQDLSTASAESLARDLNLPMASTQSILTASQRTQQPTTSQSAASMAVATQRISAGYAPIDRLLLGGISRGQVLEISGPPGSPKEDIALLIVKSFLEKNDSVIVAESQNMIRPERLEKFLDSCSTVPQDFRQRVLHTNVHTLADFMAFMSNLPSLLSSHHHTGLVVLSSISLPLQSALTLPSPSRNAVLEKVKQSIAQLCAAHHLTIVITSQMATKLVNADGSPANFDTGTKGMLAPALGPSYLPNSRSNRVVLVPETHSSGVLRLIASPAHPTTSGCVRQEEYSLVTGRLV